MKTDTIIAAVVAVLRRAFSRSAPQVIVTHYESIEWTLADAEEVRKFLASTTGRKVVALCESKIFQDVVHAGVSADVSRGQREIFFMLRSLAGREPVPGDQQEGASGSA